MKTPDEIKKGLGEYFNLDEIKRHIQCCIDTEECIFCSFFREGCDKSTFAKLMREAVRQLEAQIPKWMDADGSILCPYCGCKIRMLPAWQKSSLDMGGYIWTARGKCTTCGSITPEMHGRTAKEANAAAYAAAQWGHVPLPEPPKG